MPKYQIKRGIIEYFREPMLNIGGIFTDYLPVPLRWLLGLIVLGLILIFTGFWGLVKFILGCFWVGAIFLIVALVYQIIKNKRK